MAKAKSTGAAARGRPRRARGKLKKKFHVTPEVHNLMGIVSDNLSIVSAVAQAIVTRKGEEGAIGCADLADEIAALFRSVRMLRASFSRFRAIPKTGGAK